jgi:hypothetical protein
VFDTLVVPASELSSWGRVLRGLACAAALLLTTIAWAAAKVETAGPCTEGSVPDSIKKVLATQGYRVTLEDGSAVEFWPREQIAASGKAREDATYALARSTFVGVIHFEKNTRDYRGDAIPAGFYNLRYELQPNDGNHLGTSPTADFLVLVPPGADADPEHTYNFEQLVDLSRQVTSKKHPAPLNLVPAEAKDFPSVTTDPDDHTILFFKVKTQSGELPLALVVKGTTTE